MNDLKTALTFEDILLVPQYSEILPTEVSTRCFFARDVYLETPILSAAMDRVTESKVAQVLAQMGGLGIIHKNLSIEEQAFEVEKVKKYESGMILSPITLPPEEKIQTALNLMKKYSISGIPITNKEGLLIGILTNRDLRFKEDLDLPISELMTKDNLITAQQPISLNEAKQVLQKHRIEKLPVVDDKRCLLGLITIKDIEKAVAYPLATKDSKGRLRVGASIGTGTVNYDRAAALHAEGVDVLVVDTAHGHSKNVLDMVSYLSKNFPDTIVVGGNVVTAQGAEALYKAGADVVKVGVGSGSICTTRVVSGVGVPQIFALQDCTQVAKRHKKTLIADGGISYSGDITKALAMGAHSVMLGSLLAGCKESPGEMVIYQGRRYKTYRGMGSLAAMKEGSKERYGQKNIRREDELVPEGIEARVTFKGSLKDVVHQLLGGVRAGMGYLGASSIDQLQKNAQFIQITGNGLKESHVHGVQITREAPNYQPLSNPYF